MKIEPMPVTPTAGLTFCSWLLGKPLPFQLDVLGVSGVRLLNKSNKVFRWGPPVLPVPNMPVPCNCARPIPVQLHWGPKELKHL